MRERWTPAYSRMFDPEHELNYGPTCPRFAWLDLCHNARWEDGTRVVNGVVVPLRRGEVLASLRWMSERWGWSTKKVRSFVNLLSRPEIAKLETVRETSQGTVYRIVSYDTWANPGHSPGHTRGHSRGTPGAQPGHKEQQGSTGDIKAHQEPRALDEVTIGKLRRLYGWQGSEGTDPVLTKAFDDATARDLCLDIAIARLESEPNGEYRANWFRKILTTVIDEQTESPANAVKAWLDA